MHRIGSAHQTRDVRRLATGTGRWSTMMAAAPTANGDIELNDDAVFVVDRDDRILEVNSRAAVMSSYARDELVGMSITSLIVERGGGHSARRQSDRGYVRFLLSRRGCRLRRKRGELVAIDGVACYDLAGWIVMIRPAASDAGAGTELLELLDRMTVDASAVRRTCPDGEQLREVAWLETLVRSARELCLVHRFGLALHRRPTDIRLLVRRVAERCAASWPDRNVRVEAEQVAIADVDELRIERVVTEMFDAALSLTRPDEPVVARVEHRTGSCCVSVLYKGPPASRGHTADLAFRACSRIAAAHGGAVVIAHVDPCALIYLELPTTG
jgi:PAS domain-containing protein